MILDSIIYMLYAICYMLLYYILLCYSILYYTDYTTGGVLQARGVFGSFVGEAQARASLLAEAAGATPRGASAIPADGTRCQECGASFGVLNRRTRCGSCERFLCAACGGQNPLVALTGFRCFSGACPRCR